MYILLLILAVLIFISKSWGLVPIVLSALLLYYLFKKIGITFIFNHFYSKGKINTAFNWYGTCMKFNLLPPKTKVLYAYLLLKNGRTESAKELMNVLSISKQDKETRQQLKMVFALDKWKEGSLDEAIEMFEEIKEAYANTVIYGNLGYFYILKGDIDKAMEFNKEAYEYNSDDLSILDNMAHVSLLAGEEERAVELYEELLGKEPEFPIPYYCYGKYLAQKGEKERAKELFNKGLAQNFNYLSLISKEDIEKELERLS